MNNLKENIDPNSYHHNNYNGKTVSKRSKAYTTRKNQIIKIISKDKSVSFNFEKKIDKSNAYLSPDLTNKNVSSTYNNYNDVIKLTRSHKRNREDVSPTDNSILMKILNGIFREKSKIESNFSEKLQTQKSKEQYYNQQFKKCSCFTDFPLMEDKEKIFNIRKDVRKSFSINIMKINFSEPDFDNFDKNKNKLISNISSHDVILPIKKNNINYSLTKTHTDKECCNWSTVTCSRSLKSNLLDLDNTIIDNKLSSSLLDHADKIKKQNKNVFIPKNESMDYNYRLKRTPYSMFTPEEKKFCLDLIYDDSMSPQKVAKLCEVPLKSLKRWMEVGHLRKKGGGRKIMDPEMENKLLYWYNSLTLSGRVPTCKMIKEKALKYASIKTFKASKGWLDKFKKKYNIKIHKYKNKNDENHLITTTNEN